MLEIQPNTKIHDGGNFVVYFDSELLYSEISTVAGLYLKYSEFPDRVNAVNTDLKKSPIIVIGMVTGLVLVKQYRHEWKLDDRGDRNMLAIFPIKLMLIHSDGWPNVEFES